ncbi:hypothetical protein DMJ13_21440 [halophilic archaeon]|nr:hypothetical protein DMJ13_21440 [halophilic archaeon]
MDKQTDEKAKQDLEQSRRRNHKRAANVEEIFSEVERLTKGLKYPVSGEEIAAEYSDQLTDLPNETEDIGTALDRLEENREFESPETAWKAIIDILSEYDHDLAVKKHADYYSEEDRPDVTPEQYEAAIPGAGGIDEYIDGDVDLPEEIKQQLLEYVEEGDESDEDDRIGEIE